VSARRGPIRSALLLAALVSLATRCGPGGCGAEEGEPPRSSLALGARPEPAAAAEESAPPANGTWRVEVSGGRVRVLASRAPRREVLRELAARAGFELELPEGLALAPLSARLEGLPLDEALPLLVGALDYRVERTFDLALGAHVVRRVSVGPEEEPARAFIAPPPEDAESRGWRRIGELRERLEPSPRLEEVFEALESPDPEVRAAAAEELESGADEIELLLALLEDDPDPAVRAAAAEQLSDAESYGATQALLRALEDRDPGVVVAAVEALASSGDTSVIPQLEPLLEHREPAVRSATGLALESLRE
jgi:hypothetical protein